MYGQLSANGVCPASQAACTFDSCHPVTADGAVVEVWMASYMEFSAATLAGLLMFFRSVRPICAPKLCQAVTEPSYSSPSKASPSFRLLSDATAAFASLTSCAMGVG